MGKRPGLYANIHAKRKREKKCERKVQKAHPPQLTLQEQNKQRGVDSD